MKNSIFHLSFDFCHFSLHQKLHMFIGRLIGTSADNDQCQISNDKWKIFFLSRSGLTTNFHAAALFLRAQLIHQIGER
jgi:hypothetical protein